MGQSAKCFSMRILLLLMAWGLMAMPQYARAEGTNAVPAPAEPLPKMSATQKKTLG